MIARTFKCFIIQTTCVIHNYLCNIQLPVLYTTTYVIYNYLCNIQQVNSATASPDTILVSMTIRNNHSSMTANNVTVNFDLTSGLRLDISSIVKNTSADIEIFKNYTIFIKFFTTKIRHGVLAVAIAFLPILRISRGVYLYSH